MIYRIIIAFINFIYKYKIKKAIGIDIVSYLKELTVSYNSNQNGKSLGRNEFISKMLDMNLDHSKYEERLMKCYNNLSNEIEITNDFYLFIVFIRKFKKLDLRKNKDKEFLDEFVSNMNFLLFNL